MHERAGDHHGRRLVQVSGQFPGRAGGVGGGRDRLDAGPPQGLGDVGDRVPLGADTTDRRPEGDSDGTIQGGSDGGGAPVEVLAVTDGHDPDPRPVARAQTGGQGRQLHGIVGPVEDPSQRRSVDGLEATGLGHEHRRRGVGYQFGDDGGRGRLGIAAPVTGGGDDRSLVRIDTAELRRVGGFREARVRK